MSMVELRYGDMFDGPSDLIVLPCSTSGTVTARVREKLVHHNIPYPKSGVKLGDLNVEPFGGGENIAQYIAFAASVTIPSISSLHAIQQIGMLLGRETQRNRIIRRIAAPLLGAGSGGLQPELVAASLRDGFRSEAHEDSTLVISVLERAIYELTYSHCSDLGVSAPSSESLVTTERSGPKTTLPASWKAAIERVRQMTMARPLRVFISYSRGTPEEDQWVMDLGTFLRSNGIEARLDVWHLRRGMDIPQFMTNELALADRVIVISDERYAEKADKRVGGVGWETMIVQGDIYSSPPDSTKYVVIVRSSSLATGLPLFLRSKFVLHWPGTCDNEDNREVLLQELFEIELAPPIRPRPVRR